MDEEDFPFDIDAAIEEEQNMQFEDMYDGDQDYMEPDDVEKEMGVAAAGVGPSGMSWGGGGTALYSPPTTKYEYGGNFSFTHTYLFLKDVLSKLTDRLLMSRLREIAETTSRALGRLVLSAQGRCSH